MTFGDGYDAYLMSFRCKHKARESLVVLLILVMGIDPKIYFRQLNKQGACPLLDY